MNLENVLNLFQENIGNIKRIHKMILDLEFNKELFYPIVKLYLHYAYLKEAKELLDKCEDKNCIVYLKLEDLCNALNECENTGCTVFPLNIRYRNWWNGPHLDFPLEYKNYNITKWYPARLNYIYNDQLYLTIAIKENEVIKYGEICLDKKHIEFNIEENENQEYFPRFLELAFYNDDTLVHYHNEKYFFDEDLDKLQKIIKPVLDYINQKITKGFYED